MNGMDVCMYVDHFMSMNRQYLWGTEEFSLMVELLLQCQRRDETTSGEGRGEHAACWLQVDKTRQD
jgi:hypothetical protein